LTTHALLLCAALLPTAGDRAPADANAADLAKMQGDWMAVSVIDNGTKVADDEAQTLFRTVSGNKYSLFRFSKPLTQGTFKIDATKRPKTIDATPTGSKGPAKAVLGIYEFDGATLKICSARHGKPRPTDFDPKRGSGDSRVVWEREKK
jgi:uncharacterized protein (TIGR03067 family)